MISIKKATETVKQLSVNEKMDLINQVFERTAYERDNLLVYEVGNVVNMSSIYSFLEDINVLDELTEIKFENIQYYTENDYLCKKFLTEEEANEILDNILFQFENKQINKETTVKFLQIVENEFDI